MLRKQLERAMNDSSPSRLLRRLFRATPRKAVSDLTGRLLLENLEPRVLYSGSPVDVPAREISEAAMETIQIATHLDGLPSFEVAPLPVAEMATLRAGVVTVSQATERDPELPVALAHETAHSVESNTDASPLVALFGPAES